MTKASAGGYDGAMTDLLKMSLRTYAVFFAIALIAMAVTSGFAAAASLFGLDLWSRVERAVDGLANAGAVYVLFSTWMVIAAIYFALPHQVNWLFGMATRSILDIWFSLLGALTGFSVAVGLVLGEWLSLTLTVVFTLITCGLIHIAQTGLNPETLPLRKRLLGGALILLLVPVALVFA